MSTSIKKQKLEDKILMSLNSFLRMNTSDARLTKVSITKVELNKDNSVAKVFWDTYDSALQDQLRPSIESMASRMRSHLASVLKVRHIPEVEIKKDEQYEAQAKIENLINPNSSNVIDDSEDTEDPIK